MSASERLFWVLVGVAVVCGSSVALAATEGRVPCGGLWVRAGSLEEAPAGLPSDFCRSRALARAGSATVVACRATELTAREEVRDDRTGAYQVVEWRRAACVPWGAAW